jgi:DNA-directed RNA polymerase subunit beta'
MVKKINFKNKIFSKKDLKEIIYESFTKYGIGRTYLLADDLKNLGFSYATKAGISISIEDLKIPPTKKKLLISSDKEIINLNVRYKRGEITFIERYQKIIDIWNKTSETLKNNLVTYFSETDPLNSIFLMAFSGARGNLIQVRQLVGMRGLMSSPNGQIMDIPIIHNFREGLTITDYVMSTYGARKGVVDTALRTADSGYLTRRLIDVAQDIIIREYDCFTKRSIKINENENENLKYKEKIIGRTSAETILFPATAKKIILKNEIIDEKIINNLIDCKIKSIRINSPLTCQSTRSICQKCYGSDLSKYKIIKLGEAVGIIAAQSIGEPSTQLTMRTFHTGGVFISDSSRQIRAKTTGIFNIKKNTELKINRSIYGNNVSTTTREELFTIIDFKNKKNLIKLPSYSLIFYNDKSFIKKGDLIAELSNKNQQIKTSIKKIIAPHSGEITLYNRGSILWILSGEVYDIKNNNLINNFKEKIEKDDNLFNFKLKNKKEGFILYEKNNFSSSIEKIKISNCIEILNYMLVFWETKKKKLILSLNLKNYYILNDLVNSFQHNHYLFAENSKVTYLSKLGGEIIFLKTSFFEYDETYKKDIIKKNGKILLIPVEHYIVNKNRSLLLVKPNAKLNNANTQIFYDLFSKTNGFIQTKESSYMIEEIEIKPCLTIEFINLKEEEIEILKKYDKKIYFPGEIIFEDKVIYSLSYLEFLKIRNYCMLLIRPINLYNITKPKEKKFKKINNKFLEYKFKRVKTLELKKNIKDYKKQNIKLVNEYIWIEIIILKNKIKNKFLYKIINTKIGNKKSDIQNTEKKIYYLTLITEEKVNLLNFMVKKLKNENYKLSSFLKNFEYIEKNTVIAKISYIEKNLPTLYELKKQINKKVKILLIKKNNYQTYYGEHNYISIKENKMIKIDDKILPLIKINSSGKIIAVKPFKFIIHNGTPFFLTSTTQLYEKSGNFIKKDEILGSIKFEQIITGDIIQGLPKLEEILEARKPQNSAILNEIPGIIGKINKISEIYLYSKNKQIKKNNFKILKLQKNLIVKKNDYIYVGQALTEGLINPHNLLMTYFTYYKNFSDDYESTYLSFKHIQILLIEKIQQIYSLQGVYISDKHLEVIIKRITSKVQIYKSGSTLFLPGEIIELQEINYINKILKNLKKDRVLYYPIILGITKASLLSDSFISASSFQETTKILTSGAIEGKIDWLRGLKENVIIGRLIPVGTGFKDEIN